MALFHKQPTLDSLLPLYTLSSNQTYLIVGLGNPGQEYDQTRHNIGFEILDKFSSINSFPSWTAKKDLKGLITIQNLSDSRIILLKPTTFMNNSGEAVQSVASFYKIPTSNILVTHDELAIDFGQIRTRIGGESAGHNGIKSIISQLGSDNFGRIRVGIGPKNPPQIDSADFVLQKFSKNELKDMRLLLAESSAILSDYIFTSSGILRAETRSFLI